MKTGFIDWTGSGLDLYIFEKKGPGFTLSEKESIPLDGEPDPSNLAPLVKAGVQNIHLSIPLDLLTLREQDFPFDDSDKISDTIAFELEGILLGSTDDYSIDHIVIESGSIGSKVLAVCLEKNKLQEIIELFSDAGLDPKVITSLDICISEGKIDALFEETISDRDARAAAAAKMIAAPSINLRQDEMAYTGDIKKFRKKIRFTAFLVLLLLTILGLLTSINMIAENNTHKILTAETERVYRSIFPEDKKIIDIERQLTGNIKKLKKKKAALMGVPVLDILHTIAERKKSGITLNEFNADGNNIIIKGTAVSFEDVDSLKNELLTVFQGVKVMDSGAGVGSEINFTIMMREKDA
jgi:type II secretory pathway component PulL